MVKRNVDPKLAEMLYEARKTAGLLGTGKTLSEETLKSVLGRWKADQGLNKTLEERAKIEERNKKAIEAQGTAMKVNAEVAKAAIAEMVRQTGKAVFVNGDEDNLILSGTIVRHLTLPGCMADSMQIVKYLHDTYGDMIYISIMNQFTPLSNLEKYPELNRRITDEEYETLVDYAIEIGIENGFIQEGDTAEESFIPAFDCEGV